MIEETKSVATNSTTGETPMQGNSGLSIINHQSSIINHSIRLRGAWVTETHAERTRHSRSFGRPRTLDANEELWLVCRHVPNTAEVLLNDGVLATISEAGPFAANITASLLLRNRIVFVVASGEPLGEVLLEVRAKSE